MGQLILEFDPAAILAGNEHIVGTYVWDIATSQWVPQTQGGGGTGTGGDVNITNTSIPVSIASMPSTPVTGTFWQAVQPVSGSFYQATQPVSFPALTPTAPSQASVGTTSAEILAANASRQGCILLNLSANTVSFGVGTAAVLNSGITLKPYGTWTMDSNSLVTTAINAIASDVSSIVAIQELT